MSNIFWVIYNARLLFEIVPERRRLICSVVGCISPHGPAEEAAPCHHPQGERRPLFLQWNSSDSVWCHWVFGPICGQQTGWVQTNAEMLGKYTLGLHWNAEMSILGPHLLFWLGWCGLLWQNGFHYGWHIYRSGWISSCHPSPLWSVWHHVFEAHGWSWTDYFHGKVQTDICFLLIQWVNGEVLCLHLHLSFTWHTGILLVGGFSSWCRSGMQGTRTPSNGLWNTPMWSSTWWAENGKRGRK